MRLVIARNEKTQSVNFSGSFSEDEMNDVKLTEMERALLQDLGRPKQRGEFVNTWSIDGFVSEGGQPAEMGWGTHEKTMPPDGKRN